MTFEEVRQGWSPRRGEGYHASAPGKVILCGEHAVVYGRPAIAVPVRHVRARASFVPGVGDTLQVELPDVNETWVWPPGPASHPLVVILEEIARRAGRRPAGVLTVRSAIPVAAGMGSSAAVAVAVTRVLAQALGLSLTPEEISGIAFEAEKVTHGTPSGVDNTVIAFERPVWFVRGERPKPFRLSAPLPLLVAFSGIRASTREVVMAVRRRWEEAPSRYEALFDAVASVVREVRCLLEAGRVREVGPLLVENHRLLQEMGVSHPVLDRLVETALQAGAWGAKLAGAGWGGNVVVLAPEEARDRLRGALRAAGAQAVWTTVVGEVADNP